MIQLGWSATGVHTTIQLCRRLTPFNESRFFTTSLTGVIYN